MLDRLEEESGDAEFGPEIIIDGTTPALERATLRAPHSVAGYPAGKDPERSARAGLEEPGASHHAYTQLVPG